MKYSVQTEIEAPLEKVIRLFDDPEQLSKWMDGLQSFEHLSGTPGTVGAKSKLIFQMGSRKIEMTETITVRNLPHEFSGIYHADGVENIVKNRFEPIGDSRTRYTSEQEFKFSGFMKVIGFLMPGMFRKQSKKYLADFKRFVESQP